MDLPLVLSLNNSQAWFSIQSSTRSMRWEHTTQTIPSAFSCRNFIPWNWEIVPFSQLKGIMELRHHKVSEDQKTAVLFATMEEPRSRWTSAMGGWTSEGKTRYLMLLTAVTYWLRRWSSRPNWKVFITSSGLHFLGRAESHSLRLPLREPSLHTSVRVTWWAQYPPLATPNQCVFFSPFPSLVALHF